MTCSGISPTKTDDQFGGAAQWQGKYRNGWNGLYGTHVNTTYKAYTPFYDHVDAMFLGMNHMAYYHSSPQLYIDWIGHAGWYRAGCSSSFHTKLRAFDLTRMSWTSGTFMDTNHAWRGSAADKKRYAAVCAVIRCYHRTVLTWKYNSAHRDHIHFDNGTNPTAGRPALRTNSRADICIMQYVCNYIGGYGTTIDGLWGSQTSSHMNSLKASMGLACKNPYASYSDMYQVLVYAAYHGFRNKPVGYYASTSCGYS